MNIYKEQGYTLDQAIHHAASDDLPYLRKRLRQEYIQFLIDFLRVTKRSNSAANTGIGENIQKSAQYESRGIYQTDIKLRKDLFVDVWPNHSIDQAPLKKDDDAERSEEEKQRKKNELLDINKQSERWVR